MASSDQHGHARQIFRRRPFLIWLAVIFAMYISTVAQTTASGGLAGVVTDPSKAVLPDADVKIKDHAKGTTQSTKTDQQRVGIVSFLWRPEDSGSTVQIGSYSTEAGIFATYNRACHAHCVPDKKFPKIRKSEASPLLGAEIACATTLRTYSDL
jgi:hypothetical protein